MHYNYGFYILFALLYCINGFDMYFKNIRMYFLIIITVLFDLYIHINLYIKQFLKNNLESLKN
jgi:hypothetical protein